MSDTSTTKQTIVAFLATVAALEGEIAAGSPFSKELEEAQEAVAAANQIISRAESEPDDLSPSEIIALRESGKRELEVAEIGLRRVETKGRQHLGWISSQANSLKDNVAPFILAFAGVAEERVRAGIVAAIGDSPIYWGPGVYGHNLSMIIRDKVSGLKNHAQAVEGRMSPSRSPQTILQQVRAGLAEVEKFLS